MPEDDSDDRPLANVIPITRHRRLHQCDTLGPMVYYAMNGHEGESESCSVCGISSFERTYEEADKALQELMQRVREGDGGGDGSKEPT